METTSLTEEQLNQALTVHREKGIKLGDALVQLKFLRTEDILKALSIQLGFPYENRINTDDVPSDLISTLPINYAKRNEVLPVRKEGNGVIVAIADPTNFYVIDDLRTLYNTEIKPVIASSYEIVNAINTVYNRSSGAGDEAMGELDDVGEINTDFDEPVDLLDATDEAPIIRLVNSLMFRAVKQKASDIHIEPFEKELVIRFRIDGVLYDIMSPPKRAQNSIISRVKIMAGLNIAEKRLPQDGRIRIKIAGKDIDIRVSTIPTAFGESVVMRLLDKSSVLLDLNSLGLQGKTLEWMNELITRSHGIILVTGPTGSGKTTTLYAALTKINSKDIKILTIEDPVEYQVAGINQVQVNPKIDLTFAAGLRAFLRQDPDVIMVGEIRDRETADIALRSAMTGHMVFSTLHTNTAIGAVARLVDLGVESFLISSALLGVLSQRLVRKICPTCRKEIPLMPGHIAFFKKNKIEAPKKLYKGTGCKNCRMSGYKGRVGIFELVTFNEKLRQLIAERGSEDDLRKEVRAMGVRDIIEEAILKVISGVTTMEEVIRVTQED